MWGLIKILIVTLEINFWDQGFPDEYGNSMD